MHFNGDLIEAVGCVKDAVSLVRSGDYTSRELYDHVANALGQLNALRPDAPVPVGATTMPDTIEGCCDALIGELPDTQAVGFDPMSIFAILSLLGQLWNLIRK